MKKIGLLFVGVIFALYLIFYLGSKDEQLLVMYNVEEVEIIENLTSEAENKNIQNKNFEIYHEIIGYKDFFLQYKQYVLISVIDVNRDECQKMKQRLDDLDVKNYKMNCKIIS